MSGTPMSDKSIIFEFRRNYPFEKRKTASQVIIDKYKGERIPVIVERSSQSHLPQLIKKKYLVPSDITVGKFLMEIRKQLSVSQNTAIFLFVGAGTLPPTSALMSQIYDRHKDEDNFLYFTLNDEQTFG